MRAVNLKGLAEYTRSVVCFSGSVGILGEDSNLVPRKSVEIHPQRFYINLPMRRKRHSIHTQHRAWDLMHLTRNSPDIMNRPENIARVRTSHQLRLFRKQRPQIFSCQSERMGIGGRRRPPFHGQVLAFR